MFSDIPYALLISLSHLVIPQPTDPMRVGRFKAKALRDHPKLLREFDSTFSGSIWGDRLPLSDMAVRGRYDYLTNMTEDFGYDFSGGFRDLSLIHRGYYMYAPCGAACWSMRLYEALEFKTIPILVSDGPIQAFEKFIDWSKISVKVSSAVWHDSAQLIRFRQKLRVTADELRSAHKKEADRLAYAAHVDGIKGLECGMLGVTCSGKHLSRLNHELEINGGEQMITSSLNSTFIMKKIWAIEEVADFFDFTDAEVALKSREVQPDKSAYRLILLEIWCRVAILNIDNTFPRGAHPACFNSGDYTARREYFD